MTQGATGRAVRASKEACTLSRLHRLFQHRTPGRLQPRVCRHGACIDLCDRRIDGWIDGWIIYAYTCDNKTHVGKPYVFNTGHLGNVIYPPIYRSFDLSIYDHTRTHRHTQAHTGHLSVCNVAFVDALSIYMYVCMYVCMYGWMDVCMYVCVCIHVCIYYTHTHLYTCIHIFTNMNTNKPRRS